MEATEMRKPLRWYNKVSFYKSFTLAVVWEWMGWGKSVRRLIQWFKKGVVDAMLCCPDPSSGTKNLCPQQLRELPGDRPQLSASSRKALAEKTAVAKATHSPRSNSHLMTVQGGCKGPASPPWLGTNLKDHPSSTAPSRVPEASTRTALWPSFSFCPVLLPSAQPQGVDPKKTPW